jgi:dihydrolipoamide dehydrogenase
VPKSIAIMGSGAVGVEFASIFRRFGSEVTIIELLPRLVPIEDEAVSAELERSFKKQGIKVLTGTKVTSATPGASGVELEAQGADGKASKISAEYLLVATGRGPVTSGLGAEDLKLRMERGYIHVDRDFRTSVDGISAIGDVITFERRATRSSRTCRRPRESRWPSASPVMNHGRSTTTRCRAAPTAIPEIGSVGLTEKEAQARGFDVRVGTFKFSVLARARIAAETEGFVKIVAEKKYDEVLGVHMIGPRSTELVAEATLALRLECTVEELIRTIHAHPTMSEAVGEAAHATHGAAIHA